MRISKDEYKQAEGLLKRYNYNCIKIINIREDLISIGSPSLDGMPKPPFIVSDQVLNTVIKIEQDKELQEAVKEYKLINESLQLVDENCHLIFDTYYVKKLPKWKIIDEILCTSEITFKRKKSELVYVVYNEMKKRKMIQK